MSDWTERLAELDDSQRRLVQILDATRLARRIVVGFDKPLNYAYMGREDFLLQHGVWYKPTPWRWDFEKGANKMCFGNSMVLSIVDGLKYIEGVAASPFHPCDIHHAWNTDDTGRLIDNTWLNIGSAYLGVEFSAHRADYVSWFEDAAILHNPHNDYALFREPWQGEDFSIQWQRSPGRRRMELARRGLVKGARRSMRRTPTGDEYLKEIVVMDL